MIEEIKEIIENKIEFDNYYLPQFYPETDRFEQFQSGYRYNETTGENLIGEKEGDWKEDWFVICSGYSNDPFIVDFSEKSKNYPVYFAWHGAGHWTPIKIVDTLKLFLHHLKELKKLENDKINILNYLENNVDLNNEFWKEAYQGFAEQEFKTEPKEDDWEDWILGKIIITDIGKEKMKLINYLKTELNLTPQQALMISKKDEIEFKEGYLTHLKYFIQTLENLGATAIFRKDD